MTSTAISTAPSHPPQTYWEERARRFAIEGEGLAAALAHATALSVPIDVLLGRSAVKRSWHAVHVLGQERDAL